MTGNKELVENTQAENRWNDNFWGNGWDGKGENNLGKILTGVRNEIIAELGEYKQKKEPEIPETTSPQTCASCSQIISDVTITYNSKSYCSAECMAKQMEKDANSSSKKSENEGNSNSAPDNEKSEDQISQAQTKATAEINTTLNQDPKITDSELDYHQNWKEIIKEFADLNKIETFKKDVIAYIKVKRKSKLETEKVKNRVKNAQGKSGEELRKDLENLKRGEGDKSYQEQQPAIEELSKKSAQEDPENYRKMVVNLIREKLKTNQIEESELQNLPEIKNDWEKLKGEEISQSEEIISAEKKITKKVGEVGAQKRFDKVVEIVNQALRSGKKENLKKAIEKITKFISSDNYYDQIIYSQQTNLIKELKSKIANYFRGTSQSNSPSKFPWTAAVLTSLLAILITTVIIVIIRKKNKKN